MLNKKLYNELPLRDLFKINTKSIKPYEEPDKKFCHYSLPAFDTNKLPIVHKGSEIKSNKFRLLENSILVSKLNPRILRVWKYKDTDFKDIGTSICSTEFMIYQPINDSVDLDYYYHYFNSDTYQTSLLILQSGSTGSRMRVTPSDTLEIPLSVPSYKEQQKIAAILTSVDEAIEKTEAIIQQTETVKKGLMQELLTKGIGHTEFKETEIGEIPEEWELVSLNEVTDVRDGTHDSPKYVSEGIPLLTSKNIKQDGLDFTNLNYISNEDHFEIEKRSKVDDGDILFGMIGTVGNSTIVKKTMDFSIKNVALIKFTKTDVSNKFINYLLSSSIIQKQFEKNSNGGVQKFIALGTIRKIKVPLPIKREQEEITLILNSVEEKKRLEKEKLLILNRKKKGLMQDLLTGKVRVKVDDPEVIHS